MNKSLKELKEEYEKVKQDTINELRLRWEKEAEELGVMFHEVIGKGQPGEVTKRTAPVLFRDDLGNEWSGRGQPPKFWSFLYEGNKALPPDKVRELLRGRGFAVDDQSKKAPAKPMLKQSIKANK